METKKNNGISTNNSINNNINLANIPNNNIGQANNNEISQNAKNSLITLYLALGQPKNKKNLYNKTIIW